MDEVMTKSAGLYRLRFADMRLPMKGVYGSLEEAKREARHLFGNTLRSVRWYGETGVHGESVPVYVQDLEGRVVYRVDASF
jgi:hypothetical protein